MHAVGDGALVDALPLSQFYAYAFENALVEVVQMVPECRLKSMEDLCGKRLEVYLAGVGEKRLSALEIPQEYAPMEHILERAPELVGSHYQLNYATASKKALQSKVSVKEMLHWECDLENWQSLQRQFPELAQKIGAPFDVLEKWMRKGEKIGRCLCA